MSTLYKVLLLTLLALIILIFSSTSSFIQIPFSVITARYLMKQATVLEMDGNYQAALAIYNQIKEDYSKTQIGQDIEKYIVRASNR